MAQIYLDNHNGTRPSPRALALFSQSLQNHYASVLSPYPFAQEPVAELNQTLSSLYEFVGAEAKDHLQLCPSGAAAIAEVFSFVLTHKRGKCDVVTTAIEEAPILLSVDRLEREKKASKVWIALNSDGQVTKEALLEALTPETRLVSLSWANGITGVIQPIEEIAAICKEKGILLHVDATFVMGKLQFRLQDLPIDFLSFDGSCLHAPKGIAALFIKEKIPFSPFSLGGEPISVAAALSLGVACQEMSNSFEQFSIEVVRLRNNFEKSLVEKIPSCQLLFNHAERLPNSSVVLFPGVESESLLYAVSRRGLCATFGGGRFPKISHILHSCGVEKSLSRTALSFAFSRLTTEKEIERAVVLLAEEVERLQRQSRFFDTEEGKKEP